MLRYLRVFACLLICSSPLASEEPLVHDCNYWRSGETDADEAKLVAACDRIIEDKSSPAKDRAMAYAERGNYASNQDRKDDAIADFDKALELEPDSNTLVGWRRTRADLLHFKGLHDRAIEDYDKVLAEHPDGHVTFFRGLSYLGKGDETRGFADFAKAIELAPDYYWIRYQRGLEYAKRGQVDAALADVDKAIALKSDDRDSYLLRAELYTKNGDAEKAIADLTRAAELAPENARGPFSNRALLYEQTKQYDLALADYDKLLSMYPGEAYFIDRKAALMEKLAREPPMVVPSTPKLAVPPAETPSVKAPVAPPKAEKALAPPPEKAAQPRPDPPAVEKKAPKRASAGKGECRRYDAIANMTISVACPD